MSLREKLNISRTPLTDYAEWKKKLRRQIIIFLFITIAPVVFLYALVFRLMLSR